MRFFKLNDDEIYAVGDPTLHVVLILSRGGDHRFDDPLHVEIESSNMRSFRRQICADCEEEGSNMFDLRSRISAPCKDCPKEVIPS